MLETFGNWLTRNRTRIGYTAGVLNLLVALNHLIQGQHGLASLWFAIGMMFIWDTVDQR